LAGDQALIQMGMFEFANLQNLSIVKRNIIANFAGSGWTALLALLLIPIYLKLLGIEAWAVIGLYTSLQSLALLLDLGLSATLNREMARLSLQPAKAQEMRDLVRTFELIYWGFAAAIGAIVFAAAPLIANRWLHGNQLTAETITGAIRLMGLAIVFNWPFALYSGGLLGLQRQVLLSGLNFGISTFRGLGAVLILWQLSRTLHAFFLWQVVSSVLQICFAAWFLQHSLPTTKQPARFHLEYLQSRWRFAAGMSGFTVMYVVLMQMDKIILSRLLNLETFGYYVLSSAVAASLFVLITPLFSAVFPRFTQLVALEEQEGLKEIYHHSCQLMSVVILPVSIVIAFFSKQILFLWTGNATTVEHTHLILSVLIIGTALNGLMHLPYALQLAHGWTRLAFNLNLVMVLVLAPSIILMVLRYGPIGAAIVWVIFNFGLVLVGVQLMHHRLLRGEQWRWYVEDVGLPLAVSLGTALLCLLMAPTTSARVSLLTFLAATSLFVIGSTFLATPVTRSALFSYLRSRTSQPFRVS